MEWTIRVSVPNPTIRVEGPTEPTAFPPPHIDGRTLAARAARVEWEYTGNCDACQRYGVLFSYNGTPGHFCSRHCWKEYQG